MSGLCQGKIPTADILESAEEQGLVVIATKLTAFSACGVLYENGMRGVPVPTEWDSREGG